MFRSRLKKTCTDDESWLSAISLQTQIGKIESVQMNNYNLSGEPVHGTKRILAPIPSRRQLPISACF